MIETRPRSVTVIGGGPGGYVAAIRAAQLGARVTLIEKERLGGTCLNVGCIPTKALLHAAGLARAAREGAACGVRLALDGVDWSGVRAYQTGIVEKLVGGVAALLKANGVQLIRGEARFLKPKTLEISLADGGKQVMECDRVILATGSVPAAPPIPGLAESGRVMDSTAALAMDALPGSLAVIGGGVIGLELACAWRAFGCEVTVAEALDRILPAMDGELAALLAKSLEKQGIRLLPGHKVERVEDTPEGARLDLSRGEEKLSVTAEKVLCAVGRRAFTDTLAADAGGVKSERGKILVDEHLETSVPGVYAVGDCVGQVMLAHAASAMGEIAAENAAADGGAVWRPACIPSGVYTFPELAGAGETEEQLRARGAAYHAGRFPLSANGRALIANGGEGMVKVLIGDELDEVLGVHVLGPGATELVAEGAAAIRLESTAAELIDTIHAHPTVAEAVREAVLAAQGRAIHTVNRKKG